MGDYETILTFLGILAAFILITLMLGLRERKRTRNKLRAALRSSFGKPTFKKTAPERYAQIPQYYLHHPGDFQIDDITWNDLDLDEMFSQMDSTCCAAGEEYLYYLLRTPALRAGDLPFSREQYDWFGEGAHEEERLRLQEILTGLGHAGRYSLYDYIDSTASLGERSNLPHYLAIAAPFAAFALMFLHTGVGILLLLAVLAFNLVSYFKEKAKIAPYFQVFNYVLRLLECAEKVEKQNCPVFKEESDRIPALLASFASFRRGTGLFLGSTTGSTDPAGFVLEYVRILFHLDLIKFNSMLVQMRGRQKEIDALLTIIGRIDSCISLVSWRETLPFYTVPLLKEQAEQDQEGAEKTGTAAGLYNTDTAANADKANTAFRVRDLYHPLLTDPVSNSLEAGRPVLLTGSNASGKSTFLKAAALCALLSQSTGIAPAKSYSGAYYRIYTSMALRDSLRDGESYFIVEIKSLRRILQASGHNASGYNASGYNDLEHNASGHNALEHIASEHDIEQTSGNVPVSASEQAVFTGSQQSLQQIPVLCCIDEVLRGTNTVERIAASAEILRCFAGRNVLCFAATHDLELTSLLGDVFDNYHFSEEIEDGDVRFSYRLQPGPSTTCNAIALLGALGYDRTLVDSARTRADRFLAEGRWQ